jgi:hypothetical protein
MADDTSRRRDKASSGGEADAEAGKGRKPSAGAEQFIAEQLKAMYDEVISQPVPDRLLELLNRLEDDANKR